jgi:hypothetical protein
LGDAASDYGFGYHPSNQLVGYPQLLALPGASASDGRAFAIPYIGADSQGNAKPMISFDPSTELWEPLQTPFWAARGNGSPSFRSIVNGEPLAIGPDNRGGFWLAVRGGSGGIDITQERQTGRMEIQFYHYTDRVPKPVFSETAHPDWGEVTSMASGADASVRVTTTSSKTYHYDRVGGWAQVALAGWDTGLAAVSTPASAVAVGPNSNGLVVGPGGRIADVSPVGASLDPAAGVRCADHPELESVGPCGTGRDLDAVAVSPDGSALAGGDSLTLLWRPAGKTFREIPSPEHVPLATITSISMPATNRAYLATSDGRILRGDLSAGGWSWQPEDIASDGSLLGDGLRLPQSGPWQQAASALADLKRGR